MQKPKIQAVKMKNSGGIHISNTSYYDIMMQNVGRVGDQQQLQQHVLVD